MENKGYYGDDSDARTAAVIKLYNYFLKSRIDSSHFRKVIELGIHIGSATKATRILRQRFGIVGPPLTLVEIEGYNINLAVNLNLISTKDDNVVEEDMEEFLRRFSVEDSEPVDMITCLGTVDGYVKKPIEFHFNAIRCLRPGGAFIMSGLGMEPIFDYFGKNFGGEISKQPHKWDTSCYLYIKP